MVQLRVNIAQRSRQKNRYRTRVLRFQLNRGQSDKIPVNRRGFFAINNRVAAEMVEQPDQFSSRTIRCQHAYGRVRLLGLCRPPTKIHPLRKIRVQRKTRVCLAVHSNAFTRDVCVSPLDLGQRRLSTDRCLGRPCGQCLQINRIRLTPPKHPADRGRTVRVRRR